MKYKVTCDLVIRAFATITVEAESPKEAVEKAEQSDLSDFGEPQLTSVDSVEADESEVEEA